MKISMSESKNTSIFFIATSSFGFLLVTAWQKRAPAPLVETSCKMWRSSAGQVQFCVSWKGSTSTKWTYCTNSERHFSTPPFLSFQNCGSVQCPKDKVRSSRFGVVPELEQNHQVLLIRAIAAWTSEYLVAKTTRPSANGNQFGHWVEGSMRANTHCRLAVIFRKANTHKHTQAPAGNKYWNPYHLEPVGEYVSGTDDHLSLTLVQDVKLC